MLTVVTLNINYKVREELHSTCDLKIKALARGFTCSEVVGINRFIHTECVCIAINLVTVNINS